MNAIEEKIHNLEFQITWSENNLRFLAGEPDDAHKRDCVKINQDGIADAQSKLAALRNETTATA